MQIDCTDRRLYRHTGLLLLEMGWNDEDKTLLASSGLVVVAIKFGHSVVTCRQRAFCVLYISIVCYRRIHKKGKQSVFFCASSRFPIVRNKTMTQRERTSFYSQKKTKTPFSKWFFLKKLKFLYPLHTYTPTINSDIDFLYFMYNPRGSTHDNKQTS